MATLTRTERAAQVRVELRTKDIDIELPQETGPILVSTELKRYQLSTLVNRLLETEKPIPLEFLINGQFLRTSLDDFLTTSGISAETTLQVEYVKALVPPIHITSYEHDDWVASVDVLSAFSKSAQSNDSATSVQARILSGSFDGSLSIWDSSSQVLASSQRHKSRVNSARWITSTQIASASVDRSILLWDYKDVEVGKKGSLIPKLELCGHRASIESIAVHAPSSRILSASTDNRLGVFSTKKSEGTTVPESQPAPSKRRKLSGPDLSVSRRGALAYLEGHRDFVNDVTFDGTDATVAYSASQDHAVKTWDLTTATCVDTRTTSQSLSAICHLAERTLIAAGGAERYINLVDPRASATKVSAMILRGHTAWVTSLARDPNSDYQFVSSSNDGTCRIWDIRSGRSEASGERVASSVFVIERASQQGKKAVQGDASRVFSVCWDQDVGIASGGRDKMIQINKAPG